MAEFFKRIYEKLARLALSYLVWCGKQSQEHKNKLSICAYEWLVFYCEDYTKSHENCGGCIFDDFRPPCCCIANIPTEWYRPKEETR